MTKALSFLNKEKFLLSDFPSCMFPLYVYVIVREVVSDLSGGRSDDSLREIGRDFGVGFVSYLSARKISGSAALRSVLSHLSLFGFGEFSVERSSGDMVTVHNAGNPVALQHLKSFGQTGKVDFLTLGILEGVVGALNSRSARGEEAACLSQGKPKCTYRFTLGAKETAKSSFDFEKMRLSSSGELNPLVYRLIKSGLMNVQKGMLRIWNISSVSLPFSLFEVFLTKWISDRKIARAIDYLSFVQTTAALNFQREKFGITDTEKLLVNLFSQLDLMGLSGSVKLDGSAVDMSVSAFVPYEQSFLFSGKSKVNVPYIDSIVRNVVSVVLNKSVEGVEYSAGKGKITAIKIKTSGVFKPNFRDVPKEVRDIIDEKTKHIYFLS